MTKAWIRKNHLTLNEAEEVFEIMEEQNPRHTLTWGSEYYITQILGTNEWETGDTVIYESGDYRLANTEETDE
jgi:hypothetical protein